MADNYKFTDGGLVQLGRENGGFLGRYIVNDSTIVDLGTDLWREGTQYHIYPQSSDSEEFMDFCFSRLAAVAPENIFSSISGIESKIMYVPMAQAADKFICLDNRNTALLHGFLKNGAMSKNIADTALGEASPFNLRSAENMDAEYLSMMLNVKEIWYLSRLGNIEFDRNVERLDVYLVPVHTMSFTYNDMTYIVMALADKKFTGFWSDRPLPHDDVLTGRRPAYAVPKISLSLIAAVILAIIIITVVVVIAVISLIGHVFFSIVLGAIPILITYWLGFKIVYGCSSLISFLFLPIDVRIAMKRQKQAVERNFDIKHSDLARLHSSRKVLFPDLASSVLFDKENFVCGFDEIRETVCKIEKSTGILS